MRIEPSFKVWHAQYSWRGGYGTFQEYDIIVIAETKERAHSWVVMEYQKTSPKDWEVTEIPTNKDGTYFISENSH